MALFLKFFILALLPDEIDSDEEIENGKLMYYYLSFSFL